MHRNLPVIRQHDIIYSDLLMNPKSQEFLQGFLAFQFANYRLAAVE